MAKFVILVVTLLILTGQAQAVNWEIVSIAPNGTGYTMKLKSPYAADCVLDLALSKTEMLEIQAYFNEQIKGMIGYQFIADPKQTGIIKRITELSEEKKLSKN